MHLIDRVRNQAVETKRSERVLPSPGASPPSKTELFFDATPTLVAVALWAMAGAVMYCAVTGTSEWDIVMVVASGPLAMLAIGVAWGSQKKTLTSGIDAALIAGAAIGGLFVVAALL